MKKRFTKFKAILLSLVFSAAFIFQSCENPEEIKNIIDDLLAIISETGWLMEDENLDNIPEDITPFDDNTSELKSRIDLSAKFPPIGDQGQYGTCVVWAVGYNLKTALNGIEKSWTNTDLSTKSNQTSPKDLWLAIPSSKKGSKCEGTNFEPAMDALISTGSASLEAVPYSNLGNCTGSAKGNSDNKLANYRKIFNEEMKNDKDALNNFKGYLNAGRPIAIGAKLGDRFMEWKSSAIISSDTYNNPGMQHAYHAMVLVGYDDSKNAFRVRNSWGKSWGDEGSIWVDYDFFVKNFCFAAFVAQNTSVSIGNSGLSSGADLLAYFAEDYPDTEDETSNPRSRAFSYEVYNSGNKTIYPSQKWSVVYMYYNATDANDYGIIYEDYYSDEKGKYGDVDDYDETDAIAGGSINYLDVKPGELASYEVFEDGFEIGYTMPMISGKYYLVVMADAYDKITEVNEDNNFYFITAENGKPLEFNNGVVKNMPQTKSANLTKGGKRPQQYENTDNQTTVKPGNLNAYSPGELKTMLLHDKKSGKLEQKMKQYRTKTEKNSIKRRKLKD